MPGRGIDHNTCPKTRIVRALWSDAEKAFAGVLMKAFQKKVHVFIKVSVLDILQLDPAEPDKKRFFFWRDVLGDKHFAHLNQRGGLPPRDAGTTARGRARRPD